jgi:hypothetical protein
MKTVPVVSALAAAFFIAVLCAKAVAGSAK